MNIINIEAAQTEPIHDQVTLDRNLYFKNDSTDEYTVVTPKFYRQYTFGVFRETSHYVITTNLPESAVIRTGDTLWKILNLVGWIKVSEQDALDAIQAGILKGLNQLREEEI